MVFSVLMASMMDMPELPESLRPTKLPENEE